MTDCAKVLDANFEKLLKLPEVRFYHFPLCVMPPRLMPFVYNTLAKFKTTFLEGCRSECRFRDRCVGVHRSYERYMGAPDIRPMTVEPPVDWSGDWYKPVLRARKEEAVG